MESCVAYQNRFWCWCMKCYCDYIHAGFPVLLLCQRWIIPWLNPFVSLCLYSFQHSSMYWWHKLGVPKSKLVMGAAAYGRTFKMASGGQYKLGDPSRGAGDKGPVSQTPGFLAYYEASGTTHTSSKFKLNVLWNLCCLKLNNTTFLQNVLGMNCFSIDLCDCMSPNHLRHAGLVF